MDLGLTGKTAFVAGASRGIGLAIAESFLKEGARVALTGRSEGPLQEAADNLAAAYGDDNVMHFAGDMTATDDIVRALDAVQANMGPVDSIIANVGIGKAMPGIDVSDQDWAADITQNLTGSMFLAR